MRERGNSLVLWALFMAIVVLPLMLVAIEGTRLLFIRGEVQKSADAAAEAAARQLDVWRFEWTGVPVFRPGADAEAWAVAAWNVSYLFQRGVYVQPEGIFVDSAGRQVFVRLRATVRPLLPGLTRIPLVIRAQGQAELRVRNQP
ncbi:MAG: pilus assembly protein TadG-related protein [Armatimonadota bacterium]|nr:pilus assembly protein TadG-related protein [Armatimonadota bacterium]